MNLSAIPPKLFWQCRRGMLELDVLLKNFLEEAYLKLSKKDQATFEKLLQCSDQELFYWFTDQKKPEEEVLSTMVEKIKQHAKNRH